MKRIVFLLLTIFIFQSSWAREVLFRRSVPFAEALCNFGGNKVGLFLRHDQFIDPKTKETRGAPLVYLGSSQIHLIQMLGEPQPGDFLFLSPEDSSLCDKTQAYDLGNGLVALFYLQDNRPFQDLYHVIFYNYKADRVLEQKNLGAVSQLFALKDGFAYSVLKPRSDVDSVEMTSTFGTKMKAVDKDLNALHVVKARKGKSEFKILDTIDPKLSFEKNEWKFFFKNKADFLKAAGWNSKEQKFKNETVYEASQLDPQQTGQREICIALTDKRGGTLNARDWRCRKEKI